MSDYDNLLKELKKLYPYYKEFWRTVKQLETKLIEKYCDARYKDKKCHIGCFYKRKGTCSFLPEYERIRNLLKEQGIIIELTSKIDLDLIENLRPDAKTKKQFKESKHESHNTHKR